MSITKIDVYGDEERSVNSSKNRIAVFEKNRYAKAFRKMVKSNFGVSRCRSDVQCNQSRVLGDCVKPAAL
jgi:hypothetical protein